MVDKYVSFAKLERVKLRRSATFCGAALISRSHDDSEWCDMGLGDCTGPVNKIHHSYNETQTPR